MDREMLAKRVSLPSSPPQTKVGPALGEFGECSTLTRDIANGAIPSQQMVGLAPRERRPNIFDSSLLQASRRPSASRKPGASPNHGTCQPPSTNLQRFESSSFEKHESGVFDRGFPRLGSSRFLSSICCASLSCVKPRGTNHSLPPEVSTIHHIQGPSNHLWRCWVR